MNRVRRLSQLLLLLGVAGLAAPAAAGAHGGPIQRTPLPLDPILFAWGAAAVLVVSFAALALLRLRRRTSAVPPRSEAAPPSG